MADNYSLTIDSSVLKIKKTAQMIVVAVRERQN